MCKQSLFSYMEKCIKRLEQLQRFGTAHNYRSTLNAFSKFRNNRDISFSSISKGIMEDFEVFLRKNGLKPNTSSFYLRILRSVYNQALREKMTKDNKPFITVFTGNEKTLKRAIPINSIKLIKNLDLKKRPDLEFARDVFLFLLYCRGMSFVDFAYLRKTDIKNGVIIYRRKKTNKLLYVKLEEPISEIIEKYTNKDTPYLFPIIKASQTEVHVQYQTALRKMNLSLKEVDKLCNLNINLTTYVSRHSWATLAKYMNIPLSVISDALGHDSQITTQVYLASIETSVIDSANSLILNTVIDGNSI